MSMASDARKEQFADEGPFLKPTVICHQCGERVEEDAAWGSSYDASLRFCGVKCVQSYHYIRESE